MKIIPLALLIIILAGCSATKTINVDQGFTIDEFNNGSIKAQAMYDEIIDEFGYSDFVVGTRYEQIIKMLNSKNHELVESSKQQIKFKFVTENGKAVDFITILKFSDNVLTRRYLDFSHLDMEVVNT